MKTFFNKHWVEIALALIFFFGLGLRLLKVTDSVWSLGGYDEPRDMLVAKHIAEFGETIQRGPLAAGGLNWLMNSPLYYYFLAVLWFFSRSVVGLSVLWVLLLSLVIPLAYLVGKNVWSKKMGLLVALLFAINPQLIVSSIHPSQPNLLLIFSPTILILFTWPGKMSIKRLNAIAFLSLLAIHFHYGVLILFPVIMYWGILFFLRQAAEKSNNVKVLSPLLISVLMLLLWVILTYRYKPFDQFAFFGFTVSDQHQMSVQQEFLAALHFLVNSTWGWKYEHVSAILSFISVFMALVWLVRSPIKLQVRKTFIISLSFLASILFCVFYSGNLQGSYILSVVPIFIIVVSISVRICFQKSHTLGMVLYLFFILVSVEATISTLYNETPVYSFFNQQQDIATKIYQDYSSLDHTKSEIPLLILATFQLDGTLPFDGWGVNGIWYFLEELFQHKLVTLSNYGVNTLPLVKQPKYFYFICDGRNQGGDAKWQECLDRFTGVRSYLISPGQLIFLNENYRVWRFEIASQPGALNYNFVYSDLLH